MIDFAARYSVADGGRTIDFPAADLLNPVYERLDEMLVADWESPRFPRVANQEIELLRPHEQETKLVLEQPIYEPRGFAPGVEAGRQELSRAEADLSALRARVVRDMRQAYYQWLAAQQAVIVPRGTLELGAGQPEMQTQACIATAGSRATLSIAPKPTCSRSSSSGSLPRAASGSRRAT